MSKHTKGPWHVSKQTNYVRFTQSDASCPNICAIDKNQYEYEANARLIAAAPELLEAAKNLVADFEDTNPDELEYSAFQQLMKVIAKAEGK